MPPRFEPQSRFARREPILFVLLLAIHLAPIWSVRYLPTTDGAAHVASADVMRLYHNPALPVFRDYYYISHRPVPNLIGHLMLAGLLHVASPVIAEKLLLSLIILAFPLAMRYAVRSIRPSATAIAYVAFPMTYSFLLAQGFYNFCLSLSMLLLAVGYWIRRRDRFDWRRGLVLMALLLLLYTCHLFALAIACGMLGLLGAWMWWIDPRNRPVAARRLLITIAAMLPLVVPAILFKPHTRGFEHKADPAASIKDDFVSILQFSTMVSYRKNEAMLGGAIATVVLALGLWALYVRFGARGGKFPAFIAWDALALVSLGLLALYFKAHDGNSIHFYVPPRTLFCFFLVAALWLAGQPLTRRIRLLAIPAFTLIALGMVASHALKYREFSPQIREFVSAGDRIRPNSTFLPLIFAPQGRNATGKASSIDVAPFYMVSGYIAAQRRAVDLRNYEAKTDHFPVRFRDTVNPYTRLAIDEGLDQIPPKIDFDRFEKSGGRADYVLLWGMNAEQRNLAGTQALLKQLEARYRRIELPDAKWTELWERKG